MCHTWNQFSRWFLTSEELFALPNPGLTRGSRFVDNCLGHRGCLHCQIHGSPVEAVSLMFFTPQGLFAPWKPCVTHGSISVDGFWVDSDSVLVDDLWGHRCWFRLRIHASPVKAVSLMISEATGAVCAVQCLGHPWKQSRWWFLRPKMLIALSNPCVTRGSSFVDDFWVPRGC
jgi:hypothetical protein